MGIWSRRATPGPDPTGRRSKSAQNQARVENKFSGGCTISNAPTVGALLNLAPCGVRPSWPTVVPCGGFEREHCKGKDIPHGWCDNFGLFSGRSLLTARPAHLWHRSWLRTAGLGWPVFRCSIKHLPPVRQFCARFVRVMTRRSTCQTVRLHTVQYSTASVSICLKSSHRVLHKCVSGAGRRAEGHWKLTCFSTALLRDIEHSTGMGRDMHLTVTCKPKHECFLSECDAPQAGPVLHGAALAAALPTEVSNPCEHAQRAFGFVTMPQSLHTRAAKTDHTLPRAICSHSSLRNQSDMC